ncbi:MAG TPA: hypothetical protein VK173_07795 [Lacibacter sp.]|nr:hypothetical protein [Lacibacter sp.]
MALDKDILGQALYDARVAFSNKNYDEIIATYGTMEAYRLAAAKADAEAFINHFKTYGEGRYIAGRLQAGANVVTPNAPITTTFN